MPFCDISSWKIFPCNWITNRLFDMNWAMNLHTWTKLSSLMSVSFITMEISVSIFEVSGAYRTLCWRRGITSLINSYSMVWSTKDKHNWSFSFSRPTVYDNPYKWVLQYYTIPKDIRLSQISNYEKDRATPHWSIDVRRNLSTNLQQGWTERGVLIVWLARLSHLIPLHFFIIGYVNNFVFSVQIQSLSQMKKS